MVPTNPFINLLCTVVRSAASLDTDVLISLKNFKDEIKCIEDWWNQGILM